ncbi:hypothetical protein [Couchioplanes azureus]|uniref:hypothetical protein n=1 Tax=Couchioplanes caeruleus TaxID=56438 RepID=UPI0016716C41|nr:hypothetical protein [Couchioplanes caeruleus]GGQ67847.1 hypothetical protein GCM10010166_42290 [Couchioplanes caeruleus subsp. azureus]
MPTVGLAAAAAFAAATAWHARQHQLLPSCTARAATYTELGATLDSYKKACLVLLVASLISLATAATALRPVVRSREGWQLWIVLAGSFVVSVGYRWTQAVANHGAGGYVLVNADARPSVEHVAAWTAAADRWPYPAPGPIGVTLAILLLVVHAVLVRGQLFSGTTGRR